MKITVQLSIDLEVNDEVNMDLEPIELFTNGDIVVTNLELGLKGDDEENDMVVSLKEVLEDIKEILLDKTKVGE